MAHSWVMAHADEATAFRSYAELFGAETVLLLDTYDSLEAARRVVRTGLAPAAVRLDSGDLGALSRAVRSILDDGRAHDDADLCQRRPRRAPHRAGCLPAGHRSTDSVSARRSARRMMRRRWASSTSSRRSNAAASGCRRPRAVPARPPGRGVSRCGRVETDGQAVRDLVGGRGETGPPSGRALLQPVMRDGRRLGEAPALPAVRRTSRQAVECLPAGVRRLRNAESYPVEISEGLRRLVARAGERLA